MVRCIKNNNPHGKWSARELDIRAAPRASIGKLEVGVSWKKGEENKSKIYIYIPHKIPRK